MGRLVQQVMDMLARWETVLTARGEELSSDILRPLINIRESRRVLTTLTTQLRRFSRLLEAAERRARRGIEQIPGAGRAGSLLTTYGTRNRFLTRRVDEIAATEAVVVGSAVHATAVARASTAVARHVTSDSRLARQAQQARATAAALRRSATNLPSTRAAMQVMIVGQASTLQHQVLVGHRLGERLAYLGEEIAALSHQAAAVETTLAHQLLVQNRDRMDDLAATLVQLDLTREVSVQTLSRGLRPFLDIDAREQEQDLLQLVRWQGRSR
ncbi:MAG: hypothetical protein HY660_02115 [Armatimonadetes bacterium]|nr:hypothetical protein [Armatimonadota bacterium]